MRWEPGGPLGAWPWVCPKPGAPLGAWCALGVPGTPRILGSTSPWEPWLRLPSALPGGPKKPKLQGAGSPKEPGCAFPWCALGLLGPSPKLGSTLLKLLEVVPKGP